MKDLVLLTPRTLGASLGTGPQSSTRNPTLTVTWK